MMKKVLEAKLIEENNIAALQNTQTDVNCLGDDESTAAEQNAPRGAVQEEVAYVSFIEEEISEVAIDAESNKAMAGRFGIFFLALLLCCFVLFFSFEGKKIYTDVKMREEVKAVVVTQPTWIFFAIPQSLTL